MTVRLSVLCALAICVALAFPSLAGAASPAGRYIVVLEDRVDRPAKVADRHALRYGARLGFVYRHALTGYSARVPAARLPALRSDSRVAYVERDGRMRALAQTLPWGIDRIDADISSTRAGDGAGAVSGVNAYVIDTGIDKGHRDLNVVRHVKFTLGFNNDCNGHGTHVAGTVAARDNTVDVVGAAPGTRLTGVKVLNCLGVGLTSGVIKGVDWVTANAVKPAVANMSLGGGASNALDSAVRRSVRSGVFYALAAGNESRDACNTSPARVGAGEDNGAMTVAATNRSDNEASFSNFGDCVDIWAPGVNILSTRRGGGTTSLSGTSMASPHGAGTGALYLSGNGGATPATVEGAITSSGDLLTTLSKDGRRILLDDAGGF